MFARLIQNTAHRTRLFTTAASETMANYPGGVQAMVSIHYTYIIFFTAETKLQLSYSQKLTFI